MKSARIFGATCRLSHTHKSRTVFLSISYFDVIKSLVYMHKCGGRAEQSPYRRCPFTYGKCVQATGVGYHTPTKEHAESTSRQRVHEKREWMAANV